jgi:hypothetical protein
MSEDSCNAKRVTDLVDAAAHVSAHSRKKIGYRQAMELVGFTGEEVMNLGIYKRVIRLAKSICIAREALVTPPPVSVRVVHTNSSISSLTTPTDASIPPPGVAIHTASPLKMKVKKTRRSVIEGSTAVPCCQNSTKASHNSSV